MSARQSDSNRTATLIRFLRQAPALVALVATLAGSAARAVEVPAGFVAETLTTGLNSATALAQLPDGRILIADQNGPLRLWKNGALLATPALDLSARLDVWWERGLIGVTPHPGFPRTPHVFVLYVAKAPYTHHVLSRFTLTGDTIDPASEKILLEGDDQSKRPTRHPAGHQGGPLRFGPDGKLYVAIGEPMLASEGPCSSQKLDTLLGKILRLNADGTLPADNPFYAQTTGKYRAIWAIGLRNPFGLGFQPETGRLFATDVGQTAFEEVNEIVGGANYGWPDAEGLSANSAFKNPLHAYPPAIGRSIVGATFSPRVPTGSDPKTQFPAAWRGKFFFADWKAGWIKALDPLAPENVSTFAHGLDGPVALEFAPDGSLLVLNRSTIWHDGKVWKPGTGSLVRIHHTGEVPAANPSAPARSLADTGLFTRLAPLTPRAEFAEVKSNAAPWLPGVTTRRWLSLPVASRLTIDADGEFGFPAGTVIIQHHTVAKTGAPLETQVLRFAGPGTHSRVARAAAYRWEAASAVLVTESALVPLPGDEDRRWLFSAAEAELKLDAVVVGYLVPISPRQLDAAQLRLWITRGWIEAIPGLEQQPRLVALDDRTASLERRVRSYLEVNCVMCHRPGGLSRAQFDARISTPFEKSGLINAEPIGGDLGIAGSRLIVPGALEKSILLRRQIDSGPFRMPPLGLHNESAPVVPLLEEWIRAMK
ncbi:MAG: PQQ-dependent sugar dehydrogenase [Opitutaceae bacterium]|nr:PQQ-dependent sugar dehydrogenase [Opitutaceae bacterium]